MSGVSAGEPLLLDQKIREQGKKTTVNRAREHRLKGKNYSKTVS